MCYFCACPSRLLLPYIGCRSRGGHACHLLCEGRRCSIAEEGFEFEGFAYSFPRIALRTEPGMDLSKLYPLFTSFSVDGSIDPIEEGVEDTYSSVNNW